jgi:glycosyltransferase involved in cell wall biosynthesis
VKVKPLVSVVVPTRNRPQLAAHAVVSALEQSYANLEVIVVDDGSEPPLTLPSDLRSDPRLRILRFDESEGPAAARNAGVRVSNGSLVAFLDDDDSWRPTKIERQVAVLMSSGDSVAAVESGFDLWDADGRLVLRYLPPVNRDLARTLLEKPCLQPSTVLIRKTAFDALGGFDISLRRVEDWDLWVRFADVYRAVALPEVHVDRNESKPTDELEWYSEIVRRLETRIQLLPSAERKRIRAVHLLVEAHLLLKAGRTYEARAKSMCALRTHPRSVPRSMLYVVRSLIGERAWSSAKRLVHPARAGSHRFLRRAKGAFSSPRPRTPEGPDR